MIRNNHDKNNNKNGDNNNNIKWPIENNKSLSILLSEKDKQGKKLCELKDEDLF